MPQSQTKSHVTSCLRHQNTFEKSIKSAFPVPSHLSLSSPPQIFMNILTENPLRQPELLDIILSHLPPKQRAMVRLVNRTWDNIVTFTPKEYQAMFGRAIQCGYLTVVDVLLRNNRVDPRDAICTASANGHLSVVDRLLQDPGVDPCMHTLGGIYAIQEVCETGHLAVLDRLLQDNRFHPSPSRQTQSAPCRIYTWLAQAGRPPITRTTRPSYHPRCLFGGEEVWL